MAGVYEKNAYRLFQAAEMLGIAKSEMEEIVKKNFEGFPFSVLKIGTAYYVPKHQIDDFLQYGKVPKSNSSRGRPSKWEPGEYKRYTFPVPNDLDEDWKKVVKNIKKSQGQRVTSGDCLQLALVEFIQRRPEFLKDDDKDGK